MEAGIDNAGRAGLAGDSASDCGTAVLEPDL